MELNEMTKVIIGYAIEVHKIFGPGLLESAHEECLSFELMEKGLTIEKQYPVPVIYKDIKLDYGYRSDVLVENTLVLELKVVDSINPVHKAQLLTYMKFAEKPIGLLINFNVSVLKDEIRRFKI